MPILPKVQLAVLSVVLAAVPDALGQSEQPAGKTSTDSAGEAKSSTTNEQDVRVSAEDTRREAPNQEDSLELPADLRDAGAYESAFPPSEPPKVSEHAPKPAPQTPIQRRLPVPLQNRIRFPAPCPDRSNQSS